jgi:hypothetical protein
MPTRDLSFERLEIENLFQINRKGYERSELRSIEIRNKKNLTYIFNSFLAFN